MTLGFVGLRTGLSWRSEDFAAEQWSSQTYFDQLGEKRKERREEKERENWMNALRDVDKEYLLTAHIEKAADFASSIKTIQMGCLLWE